MITEKQHLANLRNAQKSTGPKSVEGLAVSSQNATRHGLFSQNITITGENYENFEALAEAMRHDLQPEGACEEHYVQQMINARWRQNRIWDIETTALNTVIENKLAEPVFNSQTGKYRPRGAEDPSVTTLRAFQALSGNRLGESIRRQDAHFETAFSRAHKMFLKSRAARLASQATPETKRSHFSEPLKAQAA